MTDDGGGPETEPSASAKGRADQENIAGEGVKKGRTVPTTSVIARREAGGADESNQGRPWPLATRFSTSGIDRGQTASARCTSATKAEDAIFFGGGFIAIGGPI